MKLKEIREFAKSSNDGKKIKIVLDESADFDAELVYTEIRYGGKPVAIVDPSIQILPDYWRKCHNNDAEMKGVILHEIGHIKTFSPLTGAERELYAHLWAIEKAKSLGLNDVRKFLQLIFRRWKSFKWKSKGRRYRRAREIFENNKMRYR